jgi:hypothetical protein
MSIVRDMRTSQGQQDRADRSELAWLIGGTVAAFLIGALVVFGWDRLPELMRSLRAGGLQGWRSTASVAIAEPRLGEATMAPMLRVCVPKNLLGEQKDADVDLPTLYKVLHLATGVSQAQAMLGQKGAEDSQGIAAFLWSEVADCVYRQNGLAFCDRHNRAFAVEAANAFVRTYGPELAKIVSQQPEAKPKGVAEALLLLDNRKERVLDVLRTRLRDGRLIAADFSHLTPPEIKTLVQDVKPVRDGCAEK